MSTVSLLVTSNVVTTLIALFFYWRWRTAEKALQALFRGLSEVMHKKHNKHPET